MNLMDETLHLEPEQFDLLVSEVMDELPQEWAPLLDNMAVVVEDEPAEDDLPAGSPADTLLLGCYRDTAPVQLIGGGLTGPAVAAPPEIALFQGAYPAFLRRARDLGFTTIEVSDGTLRMDDATRERCVKSALDAGFKVPATWEICSDPLPRNASGKVLRHVVLGLAEQTFVEE